MMRSDFERLLILPSAAKTAFLFLTQNFLTLVTLLKTYSTCFMPRLRGHFYTLPNHPTPPSTITKVHNGPHNGLGPGLAMAVEWTPPVKLQTNGKTAVPIHVRQSGQLQGAHQEAGQMSTRSIVLLNIHWASSLRRAPYLAKEEKRN